MTWLLASRRRVILTSLGLLLLLDLGRSLYVRLGYVCRPSSERSDRRAPPPQMIV